MITCYSSSRTLIHPGSLLQRLYESESEVAHLCPTLCDPVDCSLPGSSVHGIFQGIVLEWVAISFSRGSSQPRAQTRVSHIVDRRFTVWATRKSEPIRLLKKWKSLSLVQLFVTTVHGILQGRILEWVDIPFFRGSSGPRSQTQFSCIAGGFFTILNKRKQEENSLAS